MEKGTVAPNRPVVTGLHPVIYRIILGLCVWLVVSAWAFAGPGYTGLVLTVVSLFVAVAVLITAILARFLQRDERCRGETAISSRLAEWLSGDFDAWTGRLRATEAAAEVLLPVAAVALAMSLFALVLHLTVGA